MMVGSYIRKHWILASLFMLSVFSYLSVLLSPALFWPAVFASYAIPGILMLNFLVLFVVVIYNWRLVPLPLLSLASGAVFILVTYSNKAEDIGSESDISVLSYNIRFFMTGRYYTNFNQELIDWVAMDSSDVKCIQEYCTSSSKPGFNATAIVSSKGYDPFVYIAEGRTSAYDQGLAIFSKYKIIDRGYVWTAYGSTNAGIFADIVAGQDTVRIYNVHLESMALDLGQYKNSSKYGSKLMQLINKLSLGAQKRAEQIELLQFHCSKSPYPYIICGDFNDTPYSYNYFRLREYFKNAFEEAGNGFGFSFNSILFFLRIDHHFYGPEIEAVNYRVDRSIKTSDHFPTRGFYRLRF